MVSVEILMGEGNQSRSTMVSEENEHIIGRSGLQNSFSSLSLHEVLVAFEDSLEDFGSDMQLGVIDFDSLVDVDSWIFVGRLIEDFTLERIGNMVSNVIVSESDDFVGVEAALRETLIGVVNIGLVAVVRPGVGACHQHSPVIAGSQRQENSKEENCLHADRINIKLITL